MQLHMLKALSSEELCIAHILQYLIPAYIAFTKWTSFTTFETKNVTTDHIITFSTVEKQETIRMYLV